MYSHSIKKLIEIFSEFPTVGPRTATRFVFYLIKRKKKDIEEIVKAILDLKEKIKICPKCFNPFENSLNNCPFCSDKSRNNKLICIVSNEIDLEAIEKTKNYKGQYFVLGGILSSLRKKEFDNLRIKELEERIKKDNSIEEIILALNPTPEGQATALYLERVLKKFNKKITSLGKGMPIGGELEYADPETLSLAIENRK